MTNNKKNVHRTGALASILSQADIQPIDLNLNAKVNLKNETPSYFEPSHEHVKDNELLMELSPEACMPWAFSDRIEQELGDIEELANSIQKAGQQEPILVRPIKNSYLLENPTIKYEIIFGNRRWRACKLINKSLIAIVKNIDDQAAALSQKEENENRQDISDYSRAIHYKKLIDSGVFANENQLASKLNIPRNRFNDLMSYNRIPKQLLEVIPNMHSISQRVAIKLASLAKNPENLEILIHLAPKIGARKLTSSTLQNAIEEFKTDQTVSLIRKNIQVISKNGEEIFTIRDDSNGTPYIVLHKSARQVIDINELKTVIQDYIEKCIENNLSKK